MKTTKHIKSIREYLNENKNTNKRKLRLISESSKFQGKTIINVDIQPEYANFISFHLI